MPVDDQNASDMLNALYDMRNQGTFSANGNLKLVFGDITAEDLQGYVDHYQGSTAVNTDILDKALQALNTSQTEI